MGLDIRLPLGLLFTALALVLIVHGLASDSAIYARSLGFNVNAAWGAVMLVFGLAMLFLGRRGTSSVHTTETSPEGRAIERAEHQRGLEHGNT
jgi:hypothetical protein